MSDAPSKTAAPRNGLPIRAWVHGGVRMVLGAGCLYQTAFTLVVGIHGGIPAIPQALVAASLLSGWGASVSLWIVGAAVCMANLAPFLDVPLYPWFTLSHPLMNAVVFALCGIAWLAKPLTKPAQALPATGQAPG
jgi:hypothetical protein